MFLWRDLHPSPQVAVQEVHSSQSLNMQGCGTIWWHPAVSSKTPRQGFPPFRGLWMMPRLRYRWPVDWPGSLQPLQELHSVTLQSCGVRQSAAQRFVLSNGPVHGVPHSLFTFCTTRLRVHRPSQVGCCHSLQGLKVQGIGMQSWQSWVKGHFVWFTCAPAHLAVPFTAKKTSVGLLRCKPKVRVTIVVDCPQTPLQSADVQGFQAQKSFSVHLSEGGQSETSLELCISQRRPQ
mmetsp:Transcript_130679/g.310002  ORF Transcript_130679/g.310002 Transcript_130679/m.310002 type:complete len:234 (-) Transcript_130679:767-1468(-)